MKSTKILATIGPKTQSLEMMRELVHAGVNAMRLNFSHGDHDYHLKTIQHTRILEKELAMYIPCVLDTKGPEIRTGLLEQGEAIQLIIGEDIRVTTDMQHIGTKDMISISYTTLHEDTQIGGKIMLADGLIALEIKEKYPEKLLCRILNSGKLGEKKNVNLPQVKVQLPALAEKDKADLIFGCEQQVDYIAASFIRKAVDMHAVRSFLDSHGGKYIKIIAKIENQEGLDNIDEIISLADGIMVARGDLGVDIPLEDIPLAQKMMIHKCNKAGKLVITATQMLESMIQNPRPTRAEVTDIANAILDGTDAVMLSGETAAGNYPLEAVQVMSNICQTIDPTVTENHNQYSDTLSNQQRIKEIASELTCAIAAGAVQTAHALHAACIVASSNAGTTVRQLRKQNPLCPLVVLTPYAMTARQLMLLRGVTSYLVAELVSYDELYKQARHVLLADAHATISDFVVITGGGSLGQLGITDMIKVIQL